jgi:hypothetical protein
MGPRHQSGAEYGLEAISGSEKIDVRWLWIPAQCVSIKSNWATLILDKSPMATTRIASDVEHEIGYERIP